MSEFDHSVLDAYFRSLSQARRRVVLDTLLGDDDGVVSFADLVDSVVDAETHSPGPNPKSVAMSLTHVHLPMLADEGLIEYDRADGEVATTNQTSQIEPYLALVGEMADESHSSGRAGQDGTARMGCTWICPYCGESGTTGGFVEEGEEKAVAALRAHILAVKGDGHGPEGALPSDRERSLHEYVRREDRRRESDSREVTVICTACTKPEGVAEIPILSRVIGSPGMVSPEDIDGAESTQAMCRNCDELFPVYFETQ